MGQNSKIEWTDHTANLWHGCTKVHAGCDHCYAETLSHRWGREIWGNDAPRMEIKSVWNDLWKQQLAAEKANGLHRVFVGSMMDIFEKPMPMVDNKGNKLESTTGDVRETLFGHISAGYYPNLLFLFLTKRPSNINKYIPDTWKTDPPANVMFGTSPCDQKTADTLIPQLLQVNGKRFLSIEPLLGSVDLDREIGAYEPGNDSPLRSNWLSKIHWIIVGGESGHGARPMHPDWVRSLRDQCKVAAVPFFFKQWGNLLPKCQEESVMPNLITKNAPIVQFPSPHNPNKMNNFYKIPKHISGRLLDGMLYDEMP